MQETSPEINENLSEKINFEEQADEKRKLKITVSFGKIFIEHMISVVDDLKDIINNEIALIMQNN